MGKSGVILQNNPHGLLESQKKKIPGGESFFLLEMYISCTYSFVCLLLGLPSLLFTL